MNAEDGDYLTVIFDSPEEAQQWVMTQSVSKWQYLQDTLKWLSVGPVVLREQVCQQPAEL